MIKQRKFTVQLSLQELDVLEAYLRDPSDKKPWLDLANKFAQRAKTWREILRQENAK